MADEPNLGGTYPGSTVLNPRAAGAGPSGRAVTGTASAGLKFDIPGLKAFQAELRGVRGELTSLRKEFESLAKAPAAFSNELAKINQQLATLSRHRGGGTTVSGGTPGAAITMPSPTPGSPAPMGSRGGIGGFIGGFGGGAGGGAAGGAGSLATGTAAFAIAETVKNVVSGAVNALTNRWASGLNTTQQMSVYADRIAGYTGTPAKDAFRSLAARMPFYGSAVDIQQTLYQQATQGNVYGASGIAGQRGAAAAASIQAMQNISPGMSSQEAGGIVAGTQQNVAGMRAAQQVFGGASSVYTTGGRRKTQSEYYKGILDVINHYRGGKPLTKDQLLAIRIPGSNIYSWFQMLQWDEATISSFFDWAIDQAQYDPTGAKLFSGSADQLAGIRGTSLATETQKTQTRQAERDTSFGASQYSAMVQSQERDRQMIGVLEHMDTLLGGIYSKLGGNVPTALLGQLGGRLGGAAGGAIAGAAIGSIVPGIGTGVGALAGGGIGLLLGDPPAAGTSQLNPDLQRRVNAMMSDNPALQVTSGYRTAMQQKRLYESGHPNVAAPGKSQHGRGAAADIGPRSQLGWLTRNARRYGLQTAAGQGEPWHVQLSGTLIGDAQSDAMWRQDRAQRGQAILTSQLSALGSALAQGGSTGSGGAAGGSPAAATAASGSAGVAPDASGIITVTDAVKALYAAGFRGEDLVNMGGIGSRESHYNTKAHNPVPPDDSYGIWQINMLDALKDQRDPWLASISGSADHNNLYDPNVNAQMAYKLYQSAGGLSPWQIKGNPLANVSAEALQASRDAAKQLGYIGDVGAGPSGYNSGSQTTVSSQPVVFHMQFNISVGGGSATDLDSLARQLSSKVEANLRRSAALTRR